MDPPHAGPEDDLFADDFAGSWDRLEPFDCPPPEQLLAGGADLIMGRLGIDMSDPAISELRKLAAVEWFYRRVAGQQVTFRQVLCGGTALAGFAARNTSDGGETPGPTRRAGRRG